VATKYGMAAKIETNGEEIGIEKRIKRQHWQTKRNLGVMT